MAVKVSWDPAKAEENFRKHGVRFEEAETIFFDPFFVSAWDDDHSTDEDRYFAIGMSVSQGLLAVSYTIRKSEPWLISARVPAPAERRRYMRGDRIRDEAILKDDDPYNTSRLDWSNAVRGRHYIKPRGPITVEIDAVVAEYFRDAESIDKALRQLICEGRAPRRA